MTLNETLQYALFLFFLLLLCIFFIHLWRSSYSGNQGKKGTNSQFSLSPSFHPLLFIINTPQSPYATQRAIFLKKEYSF